MKGDTQRDRSNVIWRSAAVPGLTDQYSFGPPRALMVASSLTRTVIAHLRASLPNEGCGLLAVRRQPDETDVATRFYPGTNLDATPTRYTMDPAEVLAAFRDIAANDWSLGAIIHSHPATPPTPSPTDLREAFYPEALMLIVSFATDPPSLRAWQSVAASSPASPTEIPVLFLEEA